MNNSELIKQFLMEFIKLFVSGILGGTVVGIVNYRLVKRLDAKYELQRKKLDVLREIDVMLNWLYKYIFDSQKKTRSKKKEADKYIEELLNKVHYWEALFLDDEQMTIALTNIEITIDPSRNSFLYEEKTSQASLIRFFNDIKMTVRNKIIELQNL